MRARQTLRKMKDCRCRMSTASCVTYSFFQPHSVLATALIIFLFLAILLVMFSMWAPKKRFLSRITPRRSGDGMYMIHLFPVGFLAVDTEKTAFTLGGVYFQFVSGSPVGDYIDCLLSFLFCMFFVFTGGQHREIIRE